MTACVRVSEAAGGRMAIWNSAPWSSSNTYTRLTLGESKVLTLESRHAQKISRCNNVGTIATKLAAGVSQYDPAPIDALAKAGRIEMTIENSVTSVTSRRSQR